MPTSAATLLCRYSYDALDRLSACVPAEQEDVQRFYLKTRLATEIHGQTQTRFFQHDEQLLAQQNRQGTLSNNSLLATDSHRSVLHLLDAQAQQPLAYTAYGHHPVQGGLSSLLGFNGERHDPVTGHYLLGNGYRGFNPVLMRFNSPDSLSPFGKGGLNTYAYCIGDPINQGDPTGHWPLIWRKNSTVTSFMKKVSGRPGILPAKPTQLIAQKLITPKNSRPSDYELNWDAYTSEAAMKANKIKTQSAAEVAQSQPMFNKSNINPWIGDKQRLKIKVEQYKGLSDTELQQQQVKIKAFLKNPPEGTGGFAFFNKEDEMEDIQKVLRYRELKKEKSAYNTIRKTLKNIRSD